MKIYVRSRGVESKKDYIWVEVSDKIGQNKIDNFPGLFKDESTNLIYSEQPSVVLSRKNGQLLLLITAIKPEGRGDFSRRQIRISIGWIAEDSHEYEEAFRLLAARALALEETQQLTQEISEAVPLNGVHGFEANYSKLSSLITSCQIEHKVDSQQLTEQEKKFNKLAQNSPENKQYLVKILRQFQLPIKQGVLVVSTTNKTEVTLKNAKVWRGISSLVKSPDWKAYYPFLDPLPLDKSEVLNFEIKILDLVKKFNLPLTSWMVNNIEIKVNQKLRLIESNKQN